VHLVSHSHDDPDWLKTVDQYYTGANASIYAGSVQYIFDSVITELSKDPKKHYTFCEISYFARWYHEQTSATKEEVKGLVASEQLQFANGGWVMHDEASVHYVSMIDQTTLGHAFLKEEFDYVPTVGW
jgi:alpha-mannosidase